MNALGRPRLWWWFVASLALVLMWYCVASGQLGRDATNSMNASDSAFNDGQLHESVERAIYAAASGSIDSRITSRAIQRLRAIAVGAEATGRRASALLAWSGLAIVARDLNARNARLRQDALEHTDQLLSSMTQTHQSRQLQAVNPGFDTSSAQTNHTLCASTFWIVALLAIAAALTVSSSSLVGSKAGQMRYWATGLLLLAATSSWCLGWLLT